MKKSVNRRQVDLISHDPEAVRDEIIHLCRITVEPIYKRLVRSLLLGLIRRRLGMVSVAEGFQWGRNLSIKGAAVGRYSYIGEGSMFSGPVLLGDLSMVAAGCRVVGRDHKFDDPQIPMRLNFPSEPRQVTKIGADVWIGQNAIIMEGITIGRGSVVAAGAIVTRDVPPYSIVAGIPGRILRSRFTPKQIAIHNGLLYGPRLSSRDT